MPDLIAALKTCPAQGLAQIVASLEVVTVPNALSTTAQTGLARVRAWWGAPNAAGSAPSVKALLSARCAELQALPAAQLIEKLRTALARRSGVAGGSDTALSTNVIRLAAQGFKISESLTPAQQADAVAARFLEEALSSQTEEQRRQTEAAIDQSLRAMSGEQREALRQALQLDRIGGDTILKVLRSAGAPAAVMIAVQASGFGAYLALSTVISAVFTTFLGVGLPFGAYAAASSGLSAITGPFGFLVILPSLVVYGGWRSAGKLRSRLFAAVIWTARLSAAKDSFIPPMLLLPGAHHIDPESVAHLREEEKTQAVSQDEIARLKRDVNRSEAAKRRAESEAAQLRQDAVERENLLRHAAGLEMENTRLKGELAEKVKRAEQSQRRIEVIAQKRSEELLMHWRIYLKRLNFAPKALRWAAHAPLPNLRVFETALLELNEASDPAGLSRGKVAQHGDDHHVGFTLPEGGNARLFYRMKGARIEITDVVLKNSWARSMGNA